MDWTGWSNTRYGLARYYRQQSPISPGLFRLMYLRPRLQLPWVLGIQYIHTCTHARTHTYSRSPLGREIGGQLVDGQPPKSKFSTGQAVCNVFVCLYVVSYCLCARSVEAATGGQPAGSQVTRKEADWIGCVLLRMLSSISPAIRHPGPRCNPSKHLRQPEDQEQDNHPQ
jgi:hypothetical protein